MEITWAVVYGHSWDLGMYSSVGNYYPFLWPLPGYIPYLLS